MLVSESLVKRWFRTDSPVYKNFEYLFKNPLWQKPVPRGFTVCPFFWMSMFSALIFQPFVLLIVYIFQPLMTFFGAPIIALDTKLRALYKPIIKKSIQETKGVGLLFGLLTLIFGTAAVVIFFAFGKMNYYLCRDLPRGKWMFYPVVAFFIALFAKPNKITNQQLLAGAGTLVGALALFYSITSFCMRDGKLSNSAITPLRGVLVRCFTPRSARTFRGSFILSFPCCSLVSFQ